MCEVSFGTHPVHVEYTHIYSIYASERAPHMIIILNIMHDDKIVKRSIHIFYASFYSPV